MSLGITSSSDPLKNGLVGWYRMKSPNIATNPGFENTGITLSGGGLETYSTAHVRNGTYSVKFASVGTQFSINISPVWTKCVPGETFYAEIWVYGDPANVQTSGASNAIRLTRTLTDSSGVNPQIYGGLQFLNGTTALNGVWTKLSGTYTVPAGYNQIYFYAELNVVAAGEVYYWDDPFVANITDGSGKGNHGVLSGASLPASTTDKYGNANGAYTFDAITSNPTTLISPVNNSGLMVCEDGKSFSVAVWIKGNTQAAGYSYGIFFYMGSNNWNGRFQLGCSNGQAGPVHIWWDGSSTTHVNTDSIGSVIDGSWHHFAFTYNYNTNTCTVYIDGAYDSNPIHYAANEGWTFEWIGIGNRFDGYNPGAPIYQGFTGSLSDLRLYNRPLSATEVHSLYAAPQRI